MTKDFTMKAFKVTGVNKRKRVGIAVKDLNELKLKGCEKLQIPTQEVTVCLEEDGTEVEDNKYLWSLPSQTVLMILCKGEKWEGGASMLLRSISRIEENICSRKENIYTCIHKELLDGDINKQTAVGLAEFVKNIKMNIKSSTREEDPDWFEGLSSKCRAKEEHLRYSAKARIRGYLDKAKEHFNAQKIPENTKLKLEQVMDSFKEQLKLNSYHGHYFVRSHSVDKERMCDRDGWFSCEGLYNEETCKHYHSINPYGSKESRILFSTWNLDHVIEKSREVLPCLVEAAKNIPRGRKINVQYFYDLLFTRMNLKLVHIACHDKREHATRCDRRKIYS
ncbi:DNA fragmentation factor subunit beta [Lingula anatina]|uniref:DNAation factor subunit beta n=1 Tax=Lingula anatina TaxID=7574 RepID=A0A1S3JSC1_LINAN|nr:DNA fragmentation factor subunit beta [Lingula anatina]